MIRPRSLIVMALFAAPAAAQQGHSDSLHRAHHGGAADTEFAELQERGRAVMGVDQYTSTHRFDALPDGGRIELQRDQPDSAGVAQIRRHMREIASAFARGDFDTPAVVHLRTVPGADVMAARRSSIRYTVEDLPRGAELRIRTTDPEALGAVRDFMAFQRSEHRAGGEPGDDDRH